MTATVCAIVRNEGPYLLEWLAWQRLLGFNRVLVYDNQSTDGGAALLAALARADVLSLVPWPDQPGVPTQVAAYTDAIARVRTDWVAFLDIDEFLVLHGHADIGAFLAPVPARISAIAINQRVFGTGGQAGTDGRPVTERFTRRGPDDLYYNRWVKSIVRPAEVARPGPHVCAMHTGMTADPGGQRARLLEENRFRIHTGIAQVNHYILKSRAEFAAKAGRGSLVSAAPGGTPARDRYSPAFFEAHDRNEVEDPSIARRSVELRREMDRLRELAS